ncbi:MAG: alpha/beta hydrolase [Deltaproteobacteria bacterium]|nr:alpha/beta hydrolase [Deltaproteobacteria bacterium]
MATDFGSYATPPPWPGVQLYVPAGRIFMRRSGNPRGPKLLLLHGWAVHGGMYEGMRAELEKHFELLVPDLRGHGYSSTPARPTRWEIEHFAEDLVAALDQLEIETVHLGGYSMGGFVALALAQAIPERVQRLAIMCSAARQADDQRRNLRLAEALFKVAPPATMQVLARRLLSGPSTPDELNRVMQWLLGYNTRGGISGAAGAMRRADLRDGLAALTQPALVVTAEHDVAISSRASGELISLLPNATHRHWDDAGHALVASHGDQLAQALIEFFIAHGAQ